MNFNKENPAENHNPSMPMAEGMVIDKISPDELIQEKPTQHTAQQLNIYNQGREVEQELVARRKMCTLECLRNTGIPKTP